MKIEYRIKKVDEDESLRKVGSFLVGRGLSLIEELDVLFKANCVSKGPVKEELSDIFTFIYFNKLSQFIFFSI